MIRYILPLLAAVALTGCGAQPAATTGPATVVTTTTAPASPLAQFGTFTQADLAAAIKMAQSATPPDTEAAACFGYISANLAALQGQIQNATAPVGAFSAFETANIGLGTAGNALSPASKTAVEVACGPLAAHVVNSGATLLNEVVAILGQVGIHAAIP